jgi:hypothetical protein
MYRKSAHHEKEEDLPPISSVIRLGLRPGSSDNVPSGKIILARKRPDS